MTRIFVFPGQGSQKVGMGEGLFPGFAGEVAAADDVLGYSIQQLCLLDPEQKLGQTEFTQPALYVVNTLSYLKRLRDTGETPDFVAGHSLGEYNALFSAGVFDFATGLRLVQKRGELMARVTDGGMAAVLGLGVERVREILRDSGSGGLDIANLNTPAQVVISGPAEDVRKAQEIFQGAGAKMFVPLKVSGAFHSRYMETARMEFDAFLAGFQFSAPTIPVVANVTAAPYGTGQARELLSRQITSPVRWAESIQFLLRQPKPQFEEIGPGKVLTGLIRQIVTTQESGVRIQNKKQADGEERR